MDPYFAVLIHNFSNQREEPLLDYEDIFDDEHIMTLNTLIYRFADKLILMKDKDDSLIKNIRTICNKEIDTDYQSLEFSYEILKNRIES